MPNKLILKAIANPNLVMNIQYGYLYNRYALLDARNIANTGWHVPTMEDYATLRSYIGGTAYGYKLVENVNTYWLNPYSDPQNNLYKFNGRGSGARTQTGSFVSLQETFNMWAANNSDSYNAATLNIQTFFADIYGNSKVGTAIRLIKDGSTTLNPGETSTYIGNDLKTYSTICIGSQEWLSESLCETKYRNGDLIPEITIDASWATLTSGARCSYNNDENNAFIYQYDQCLDVLKLIGNRNCSNKLLLSEIIYETPVEPSIYTFEVINIEGWSALGGGNCTAGGNSTYKGIVISTSPNPDITDTSILYGSRGQGSFYLNLPNLTSDTSYYVRAFAYNAEGLVYGNEVIFSTPIIYNACATYDLDFYPLPSTTGFLDCGNVSSGVGATIGNYTIEWRYESSTGPVVFTSGSNFAYDASIQAEHPLTDELVLGGTLYPVVKSIYINGIKHSAYNWPDASYSPDLRNCLTPAIVNSINCDTSYNYDGVYSFVLTYNNVTDKGLNKSRSIKYDICPGVKYLAWEFDAVYVAEQIKFYYCTSTNSDGILLDNFVHGSRYVPTSPSYLYPSNYPDGSARYYSRTYHGTYGMKYITRFDNINYSTGDYIKIQIIGSVLEPTNTNTNWTLKLESLTDEDINCTTAGVDTSISKISGDPSLNWSENNCRYDLVYNTESSMNFVVYNLSKSSTSPYFSYLPWIWRYLDIYSQISYNAGGYDTRLPVDLGLRWSKTYNTYFMMSGNLYTCQNLNPGQSITASHANAPDASAILFTFTDVTDYNFVKNQIAAIKADSNYTIWQNLWNTNSSDDTRYFGYYQVYLYYNASTCGDQYNTYALSFHLSSDISYNDTNKTVRISTEPVKQLVNPVSNVSCNETYTAISNSISTMNYVVNSANLPITTVLRSEAFIMPLWPIVTNQYTVDINPYLYFFIEDAMLNGICDLSQFGFFKDSSIISTSFLNRWMLFRYYDRVTFTSNASTHENRMQNWKLERKIFLRTDSSIDTGYETIYEVSLGVKL